MCAATGRVFGHRPSTSLYGLFGCPQEEQRPRGYHSSWRDHASGFQPGDLLHELCPQGMLCVCRPGCCTPCTVVEEASGFDACSLTAALVRHASSQYDPTKPLPKSSQMRGKLHASNAPQIAQCIHSSSTGCPSMRHVHVISCRELHAEGRRALVLTRAESASLCSTAAGSSGEGP